LKLRFHLWVHEKSEKAKNCPVHSNEHYSILIIVFFFRKTYCFFITGEIRLPENVATDILQQDGLAHLVLPRQDKRDSTF